VPVDITAGEQFDEEFLKISPNNKMPAIVDPEGPDGQPISVFESGAILVYLAEKTGMFYPSTPCERYLALQWLMFQIAYVGPMLGQAHYLRQYAPEEIPYAVERYTNEAARLYGVMDRRLDETEYFAGEEYSNSRHGRLPVGRAPREAGPEDRGLPEPQTLVRGRGGAVSGAAIDGGRGGAHAPDRGPRRGGTRRALRKQTSHLETARWRERCASSGGCQVRIRSGSADRRG